MNQQSGSLDDSSYKPIPKRANTQSEVDPSYNVQIYPGINPITNTQNQISSEAFVNAYPKLIHWIASNNLEAYLNDHNNTLIKRKDQLTTLIEESKSNAIHNLYDSRRSQAYMTFYEAFASNWKNQSYDVYKHHNLQIPKEVVDGYNATTKSKAKELNQKKTTTKNTKALEVFDEESLTYINYRFNLMYDHWSLPLNPHTGIREEPTLECKEARLIRYGLKLTLDELVNKAVNQIRKDATANTDIIKVIKTFFTNTILQSSYPPEIGPLIDNYQFALAWESILKYNLVTIDKQYVSISLMKKILNTTYTNEFKSFPQFYTTFVNNCAMYLFSEWYQHFTYAQIKHICDTMTKDEFTNTYSDKINEHNLTIPPIVQLPCRKNLIFKAVQDTHLRNTVDIYQSSNSDPNELSTLIDALRDGDFRTTAKFFPKTTLDTSNRCGMCTYLKNELRISNIKFHNTDTQCPPENQTTLGQFINNLKQKPHSQRQTNQSQRNHNATNSNNLPRQYDNSRHSSMSSQSSVVSNPTTSSKLQPLPPNFDEFKECAHCYRSGNANPPGMHSANRKAIYHDHPSRACLYNYYKNNKMSDDSANPFRPLVANNVESYTVNPFVSAYDSENDPTGRKRRREENGYSPEHDSTRSRPSTPHL